MASSDRSPGEGATADRRGELQSALHVVRDRLERASAAAGRDPREVTLVAVTKYHPLSDIEALSDLGLRHFGESRVQDLLAKSAARPELTWHVVGRLQTNKARRAATVGDLVHSYDRLELVGPLARGAAERPAGQLAVLVQVSLDGDPSRGGAPAALVDELADAAATAGLTVAGVMAVAPQAADPRAAFDELAAASQRLRQGHPQATAISAGMSGDLEAAVARGATHVRIGTALLGARPSTSH